MTLLEDAIQKFVTNVDPGATRLQDALDGVPEAWQPYLPGDTAEAQVGFRREMTTIEPYLPETAGALESIVMDGCLVQSPIYGICRIVVRQVEGTLHPAWSRAPVAAQEARHTAAWPLLEASAPEQYVWIMRNVMNGLTDLYGFGGPMNTGALATVERQIDTFAEAPWWDALTAKYEPAELVVTFSSGGGAYLVYDTGGRLGRGPEAGALLLDVKSEGLPDPVSFLSYLDAWTAIGLAE